jgi:hypothetical protein
MKYILTIIPFFFLLSCGDSKSPITKTTNLDSLLVLYPDSIPLLIKHGSKMLKEFQYDKAFAEGAKAFRLDSNNIEARLFYADVLNNRPNRTVSDVLVAQRHFKVIIKKNLKI